MMSHDAAVCKENEPRPRYSKNNPPTDTVSQMAAAVESLLAVIW